jgi:hypothetical protein
MAMHPPGPARRPWSYTCAGLRLGHGRTSAQACMSAMIMHLRVGYDYASARICASAVIVNLPATDENLRYC